MNRTIKSSLMRTAAVMLLTLGTASASAQYYMNIRTTDGTNVQYVVTDIDSVWFTGSTASTYEYVDLGLSVMWATCNVGATKPEEYGDYFAWGETETKAEYGSNYKWCNSSSGALTKYNNSSTCGTVDNKTILDAADDVAHVKWGGSWRMPTKAEQDDLRNKCTWTWYESGNTEFNGVAGYKVTSNVSGYRDRFIFLPAAGNHIGIGLSNVSSYGLYWSSSLYTDGPGDAWSVCFTSSRVRANHDVRDFGFSVRPVCPHKNLSISLDSTSLSLKVDNTYPLKATVLSGDEELSTTDISWKSDNESVATVSAEGLVTAKAAGTATITASCQDKTASCVVIVSAASSQEEVQYEYVDLGLSVKWATFNVGASKPEEYGDYFAWGETETKTDYSWSTYKFRTSGDSENSVKFNKYNTNSDYGIVDNKTTLDPEDDVARVKWGGSWRMPTKAEQDDLRNKCTWTWYGSGNTEFNGVAGYKVTSNISGYTDRSIFLPAAGSRYDKDIYFLGQGAGYWSSSLDTDYLAWFLDFSTDGFGTEHFLRSFGQSVRPVYPSDNIIYTK